MPALESFVKAVNLPLSCCLAREYILRVAEKRELLRAEAAEVNTTKLMRAAAHLIPMSWKTITNGDLSSGI